jgi:hypothetical protein
MEGYRPVLLAIVALVASIACMLAYTTYAIQSSERQWCGVIDLITAQKAPAGNPGKNPSRAYLQALERAFNERSEQLGC